MFADDELGDAGPSLQLRGQLLDHDRAATDDVDPALMHRSQRRTLRPGHHDQLLADLQKFRKPNPGEVDGLGVIGRHSVRQSGQRGERPGQPHPGAGPFDRYHLQRFAQPFPDHPPGISHFGSGRRIRMQTPLGHPDAADVSRVGGRDTRGVAKHHLGGSAAEIDHYERPCSSI